VSFSSFVPFDQIVRVSLRQEVLEVPPQDIITRDNVTLKVNAVITLKVVDPSRAVIEVMNYVYQTSQFAQTTLRSVLGEVELDELLSHREVLNQRIQTIIDQHTAPWGVKVVSVAVKQVDLPESMLRAIAKQAEAEREKRAKVIHAEGEFAASQRLVDAAALLATQPMTLQLRYLQTLQDIGVEKNTTIVFPLPLEMMTLFNKMGDMRMPAPCRRCGNQAGEIAMRFPARHRRRRRRRQIVGDNAQHGFPAGYFLWPGFDLWRVLWFWLLHGPRNGGNARKQTSKSIRGWCHRVGRYDDR
jgi:hypothetical protein